LTPLSLTVAPADFPNTSSPKVASVYIATVNQSINHSA